MPNIGVFGDQPQGLAFTPAADQDRDVTGRLRVQLGQPRLDPGQPGRQVVKAAAGGAELVAVLVVVPLFPAGTDPQHKSALRNVVDGPGHVGQ